MTKKSLESEEMISFNSALTEFSLSELESRQETDPLAVGGLLDIASSTEVSLFTASDDNECTHCSGQAACNVH